MCHCESAGGGRGNPIVAVLAKRGTMGQEVVALVAKYRKGNVIDIAVDADKWAAWPG